MCVNCGVSSCSSCNTDSYIPSNTSALKYDGPKFVCPSDFTVLPGTPLNDVMNTLMGKICVNSGASGGFVHYLGEEFEGGVIYYLYKDNLGVERGLIVNKEESTAVWQATPTATGADTTEDGALNTSQMTSSAAATYVNGLTDGGFTDWYLPSTDELNLLFYNRYSAQKTLRVIAGADLLSSLSNYWSSTERDNNNAFTFYFFTGAVTSNSKVTTLTTRAIRSF